MRVRACASVSYGVGMFVPSASPPPPPPHLVFLPDFFFCLVEGWTGANCSVLDLEPVPDGTMGGAYGVQPNVSSWGGNAIKDSTTGK